jgi:hypothetical protein
MSDKRGAYERCHIEGCTRKTVAFGLCTRHYQLYRKYGDPYYRERPGKEPKYIKVKYYG